MAKSTAPHEEHAVVKKDEHAVTLANFEEDAGAGLEATDKDSFAIPILAVVQQLSKSLQEDSPSYVAGAKVGMITNNVSGELYNVDNSGVPVIPLYFERKFVRSKEKDGSGFMGEYTPEHPLVTEAKRDGSKLVTSDGTFLTDTRVHTVLVQGADGSWQPAILPMRSTQIGKSRKWITNLANLKLKGSRGMFNPPTFSQIYRLTTKKETSDKNSWYGLVIEHVGTVEDAEVYAAAKAFHELVRAGKVKASAPADLECSSTEESF
jgi:hypothetical protein